MVKQTARAKWRAIVARHEASGQTIKAFAESEGLNPNTLGWWRWRLRQREVAADVAFTELTVVPAQTDGSVVLALDDLGAHVVVDRDTDLELLRDVLAALS